MKPNFKAMSRKELKAYVLEHRDDNEAISAYIEKSEAEGNWVTMPPLKSMEDLDNYPEFLDKIRKDGELRNTAASGSKSETEYQCSEKEKEIAKALIEIATIVANKEFDKRKAELKVELKAEIIAELKELMKAPKIDPIP